MIWSASIMYMADLQDTQISSDFLYVGRSLIWTTVLYQYSFLLISPTQNFEYKLYVRIHTIEVTGGVMNDTHTGL